MTEKTQPLKGRRILITRDISQADSFKNMLLNLGADVRCIPTISIGDPPDWKPFDEAAEIIDQYEWLLFTSLNAVTQTKSRLEKLKKDLSPLKTIKIAVVGDKTAKSVTDNGWNLALLPDHFQAEGVFAELEKYDLRGKKIWFPRALEAREYLVEELTKTGAEVDLTPVYQNTLPWENKDELIASLKQENMDWVTFTSSSTADNFFLLIAENRAELNLPKIASIGRITTETLNFKYDINPTVTAIPQNLEGLCQAIVDWEKEHSHG